jgi:DNA-binding GntR family transcriptional regulator
MPAIRVDPHWPKQVYLQIADDVQHRIETGEITYRLPGERGMADEYGASIGSVRRAMIELRKRGLVETLEARGTYVASALAALRSEAAPS